MSVVEKLDVFFCQFKLQKYNKGEVLLRSDEIPTGVFYLKTGLVKMYFLNKKGDELIINIFKGGSFFPMSWAINNTNNYFYFEAASDAEVWKAPKDRTIEFLSNNSEVMFDLLSRIYRGTDNGFYFRMVYLMSGGAYERLIIELLIDARRFGIEDKGQIVLKISEKDLSSQTGLTRETVSRGLKKLKVKTLITFAKGKIVFPNLALLEEELCDIV
ncbi:MAG TPA: Crp/Fnr family transcriptional regulator [Patescibacteria group bacterium]